MRKTLILSLLFISSAAFAEVPIVIDPDRFDDAPYATGKVIVKDFLAVRSDPAISSNQKDQLHNGDEVIILDNKGEWMGIVYPNIKECQQSVLSAGPYKGPCKSGWVNQNWVK